MSQRQSKQEKQAIENFESRRALLQSHRLAATSADFAKILGHGKKASVFEFTLAVSQACDAMGVNTDAIFATDRNPKVVKRFVQFMHGINAKDYKAIDKTTAKILYAMRLAGEHALTTDALAYIVSGRVRPTSEAPETRGVSTRVVSRLFGHVGATTAPTQISRSVGENGFLTLAGAVTSDAGKVNRPYTLNAAHEMVARFFAVIEGATDGQLDAVTGQGEGTGE
jgi:hypothetical protein